MQRDLSLLNALIQMMNNDDFIGINISLYSKKISYFEHINKKLGFDNASESNKSTGVFCITFFLNLESLLCI